MIVGVTRPYRMKARAETVEETRHKVLEAARAAILDGRSPGITMGDIARRAGVARSTLYATYGSLGGLIGAVTVDAAMRGGFDRVLELFNQPDAGEAIRLGLAAGARMYASDYELTKRVRILARLDPDVMSTLLFGENMRADGMKYQADRLADQGRLRPQMTRDEAARVLWLLSAFETYEGLHTTWGMKPEQIADFLTAIAGEVLLRD
jgi:AcrR family transcriptional regulator